MVKYSPKIRPTIGEIFSDPWMKEIMDLCKEENKEEYEKLEDEIT